MMEIAKAARARLPVHVEAQQHLFRFCQADSEDGQLPAGIQCRRASSERDFRHLLAEAIKPRKGSSFTQRHWS